MILTHGGDDAITVDGAGNKTIDGGSGTDSLTITLSGHTSLSNFEVRYANSSFTLTSLSTNETISFSNIENLTVGSQSYSVNVGELGSTDTVNVIWGAGEGKFYGFAGVANWGGDDGIGSRMTELQKAFPTNGGVPGLYDLRTSTIGFVGSEVSDTLRLDQIRRDSDGDWGFTGSWNISLGDGNDEINGGLFINTDSVDMGAGDDFVRLKVGSVGTPTYAALDMTKLDGGSGTDTLSFADMGSQGSTELTLTHGGATNFENIDGTGGDAIIRGDTGANVLRGSGGTDTIYGGGGDDSLTASFNWHGQSGTSDRISAANSGNDTDDKLYGEAGNDLLIGTVGDNILDGGTGADTIYSGNGSDTIVLRVGDGGSTLAAADTIADFTDGSDFLGLDGSFTYTDLTIAQGTGSNSSDTIIKAGSEYLAILTGITSSSITELDFTPVDIS